MCRGARCQGGRYAKYGRVCVPTVILMLPSAVPAARKRACRSGGAALMRSRAGCGPGRMLWRTDGGTVSFPVIPWVGRDQRRLTLGSRARQRPVSTALLATVGPQALVHAITAKGCPNSNETGSAHSAEASGAAAGSLPCPETTRRETSTIRLRCRYRETKLRPLT